MAKREEEIMAVAVLQDKRTISANGRTSNEKSKGVKILTGVDDAAEVDEEKAKYPVAGTIATLGEASGS